MAVTSTILNWSQIFNPKIYKIWCSDSLENFTLLAFAVWQKNKKKSRKQVNFEIKFYLAKLSQSCFPYPGNYKKD